MKSLRIRLVCFVLIFFIFGCGTTIKTVITSDPPGAAIYMGDAPDNLSYVGTTPKTLKYHDEKPYWKAWYYQIKKDGFEDSELIFKAQGKISADRYVHASLEPLGERDTDTEQKGITDAAEIKKVEEKKVIGNKEKIKPQKSEARLEDENVKCAEIRRLSDESMGFLKNLPQIPHDFHWDWGTKSYHPPLQSFLDHFNKVNEVSLKILKLMDELHTSGPETQIPDCNPTTHLSFCRKATVLYSGKGLIDHEEARIQYEMTARVPAILIIHFTVLATSIEILGHGFTMISELPKITYPSTRADFKGVLKDYYYDHTGRLNEKWVKASQFVCIDGPSVTMSGLNSPINLSIPHTATVKLPNGFFLSKKGFGKGPMASPKNFQWSPILLTNKDLQKALEKGRLTLRRETKTESLSGTVNIDFAPPDPELQAPAHSNPGGIGLWGDRTTHGGFLLATEKDVFCEGHPVAKEGDPVLCPVHGLSKVSRDESSGVYIGSKTVAVAGGKADCGAKILGRSTLTLVQPVKQ